MKKILFLCLSILISVQSAYAEKVPVRIAPTQLISTHHDEVEIGDWIPFEIINDVYVNNKLYIAKGTPIYGFVDFFKPNGWVTDSAEIYFKKFETKDADDKKITINYPLKISYNSIKQKDIKLYFARTWRLFSFVRGAELYIEPDTTVFNLFITQ